MSYSFPNLMRLKYTQTKTKFVFTWTQNSTISLFSILFKYLNWHLQKKRNWGVSQNQKTQIMIEINSKTAIYSYFYKFLINVLFLLLSPLAQNLIPLLLYPHRATKEILKIYIYIYINLSRPGMTVRTSIAISRTLSQINFLNSCLMRVEQKEIPPLSKFQMRWPHCCPCQHTPQNEQAQRSLKDVGFLNIYIYIYI